MKRHTTTSYSEAKANELGVNVTRGDIPPDPPNPEGKPPTPSAARIAEAERRIFERWYATASVGAKFAYWTRRAKEVAVRER